MTRVAILGAGDISARYAAGLAAHPGIELVAVASRRLERAQACAGPFGAEFLSPETLFARRDIDWLINLTPPLAHAATTEAALEAGFHVYAEKPLAATGEGADRLIDLAERKGLHLACAPATFLGPAQQTARALLDGGALGAPLGASTTMIYPGPDLWHHAPQALFGPGAGPIFDMGVYDVTALAHLFGDVAAVTAAGGRARDRRKVAKGPDAGCEFPVTEPTHAAALLEFASGPVATVTLSFDGVSSTAPGLEIQGSAGALALPRSGMFEGPMKLSKAMGEWERVEPTEGGWSDKLWVIGVLEAIDAAAAGARPRTHHGLARHVLEVLEAIASSVREPGRREISSRLDARPAPLEPGAYARLSGIPAPERKVPA
jgi:predicted dehydrogenase